jgi:hypothetical protein
MKSRTLVLDGQPQKTTVNPNKAKYVIHVPIPDEIWGAHYSILKTSDAIDSTDPSLFESDVSGPTIRVPETLVLRYKGVSTPFKLKEGNSTRASSGQVFNSSGPAGNALVITSWPDCSMKPHSMNNFNLMIDSSKGNPSFHLTEIAADAGGDDVGISALPSSVLSSMPSCAFAAAKVSSKAGPAKKTKVPGGNETDQEVIFNVDATGCGIV